MPCKPIDIKVFAVCCAYTAVLLGFEVYVGTEQVETVNTAIAVVQRLIEDGKLDTAKGRTLYTDNWYTSVKLAQWLWEKKCWRFCGTIVPTNKAAREGNDVPFHKVSKGALNTISRGWFWEAVLEKSFERSKYCVQCTTWKDRKQVMFLHTSSVGSSRGKHTVRRGKKGKHGHDILPAPLSQLDYALNFSAVDRNDRDSADYTTSLHTNRRYLHVMFWLLD